MKRLQDDEGPVVYRVTVPRRAGGGDSAALRVDVQSLEGMQKEAIVTQLVGGEWAWRMASDEGPYLNGTDLAPFPLAFFAAGLQFSLFDEILRHADLAGIRLRRVTMRQDTFYTMQGSVLRGDMTGGARPAEQMVSFETDAAPVALLGLVAAAQASSPAEAVMRDPLRNTFSLTVNGRPADVEGLAASVRLSGADPRTRVAALGRSSDPDLRQDIVRKVASAERVVGVEGGVATSLQPEQKRTLHIRAEGLVRDDGLFETTIHLIQPLGSNFRLLCDPGEGAAASAPPPLAYLAAGTAFCYMTQLGRYAQIVKQSIASMAIAQYNKFHRAGLASAEPVDTHVFIDSDEPVERIVRTVRMGEQTCFLHAAMKGIHPTVLSASIDGGPFAIIGAASVPSGGA